MTETTEIVLTIGAILLLLILSAFFSGSETALTAASRARMHQAARQGNKHADMVLSLIAQRDRLIGAILLGNNLVNILASALATSLLLRLVGETGVVYATLLMTMLVLIFAEVLPKTYAIAQSEKMALFVAPTIRMVIIVFSPVVTAVQFIVRMTLRTFGIEISHEITTELHEEELRGVIELHEGEDPEIQQERSMLRSILELDDVEVGEIMTHRRNVVMLDVQKDVGENVDAALESPFTRLPVYQDEADNIVGVLHAKSLLREVRARNGNVEDLDLAAVASDPWFIPDSTSLLDQLEAFKKRREHFAVVVDEYGTFMGIVTLEDILEEIVGDIDDETDVSMPGVRPQPDGSYIIDGTVTLRDLNRDLDWELPDDDASTIAGLVLHEARMIPEPGQSFVFHGLRFDILRRQRNQITALKVTPMADEDEQDQTTNPSDETTPSRAAE
ncbi:HlyC/CorC family transporter [Hwanghaeella grinnelliae]|uniref:HlyC/CorC family transporter n=1 Tax=Hwanghaeella grinnelliae TaxID=2500179 RepID=A0A437QPU5_9PROT|nr:HlyC/CorC family transporter [Hwanghaeella grinnelliae]RVU36487.1 HlyC/CorC family transporter [Hwanghaeella grinnelliae]